ncbi:MAG: radical SAM family heme chaperone HemW [Candidatus Hydrogenedentes bacterium]|nr:radical SAM family heme chaperone HemW [Candidatus Hydrogenedentota bacterium]
MSDKITPMLGIYLHIPYCKTLCPYCDFVKERSRTNVPEAFVEALCREITAFEGPRVAESVFFGGGTPSLLTAKGLEAIMKALHARFTLDGAEITLEANPDDLSPELVKVWRALGINRVSLGVQSFEERVLRYLGRRHDVGAARRACEWVGNTFDTWSLDLIFGAPPIEAWEATLKEAVAIAPPHISAYNLTYEVGTPFGKRADQAIPDDVALRMFKEADEILGGYDHYEISNYAKPGHQSRHNLIYWHNESYAGFGTGAYSYIEGVRARNAVTTDAYLRNPGEKVESEHIAGDAARLETLIQHFRLEAGMKKAYYQERFGNAVEDDFDSILDVLIARGLLAEDEDRIWPTEEGYYLNNEIGLALIN